MVKTSIAWMFHYIRPKSDNELRFLNVFDYEIFIQFLDWFENEYDVTDPIQCLRHIEKNGCLPYNSSILTFDDGLIDHYKWVYPELKKRNLSGIFFVTGKSFTDKKLLRIHKTHAIYGLLGYDLFIRKFINECQNRGINQRNINEGMARSAYPYDSCEVAKFKFFINFKLDHDIANSILDSLISEIYEDKNLHSNFYLNKKQAREMHDNGMVFGYHGFTHEALAGLNSNELSYEMHESKTVLENVFNSHITTISYPFGDLSSIRPDQIEYIKNDKCCK